MKTTTTLANRLAFVVLYWFPVAIPERLGIFRAMTNPHAAALGALGGSRKTPAKARASRVNGSKGGRPKKISLAKPKR